MKYLLPAVFVFNLVNFLAFLGVAKKIGGDAINGKIEHGHYYLASHGHLTEVSAHLFAYSRVHATSLLVTFPMALVAGACCVFWLMDEMKLSKRA